MAEEKEAAGKKQEADKGKDQKEKTEAAASGGSPKMMFWGIIAGLVVLELIIMYFVIGLTRPKSAEELASKAASDSMKVSLEHSTTMGSTTKPVELVTNVAGTEGERFIKVAFILEFEEPEGKKAKKSGGEEGKEAKKSKTEEEILRRMPKFKNMLIDLLSSKTLAELNEPNTREQIRKDFMRDINSSLPSDIGKVTDVLFDQFVIQ